MHPYSVHAFRNTPASDIRFVIPYLESQPPMPSAVPWGMDFFTEIGRQCVSIQKIAKFSKTRYMVGSMLDPTIYHCRTPFPYGGFCNPADATSAGELLTQDSPGTNTRAVQEGDTGHCVNLIPRKVFVENT